MGKQTIEMPTCSVLLGAHFLTSFLSALFRFSSDEKLAVWVMLLGERNQPLFLLGVLSKGIASAVPGKVLVRELVGTGPGRIINWELENDTGCSIRHNSVAVLPGQLLDL